MTSKFDNLFKYDFAGRTAAARSAVEAGGSTETDLTQLPYRQFYNHDAFGHISERDSTLWDYSGNWYFWNPMTNNRVSGGTYDDEGQQTWSVEEINFQYDGAKAMIKTWRDLRYETLRYVDGTGNEAKRSQRAWDEPDDEEGDWEDWKTRYFIYSSVLGQNVTEASETGKKRRTYVIASGATIARQGIDEGGTTEKVGWEHRDPSGLSTRSTSVSYGGTEAFASSELDALGNNVGAFHLISPVINKPGMSGGDDMPFTDINSGAAEVDGILMPAAMLATLANTLTAIKTDLFGNKTTLVPRQNLPGGGLSSGSWESSGGDDSGGGDACIGGPCDPNNVTVNASSPTLFSIPGTGSTWNLTRPTERPPRGPSEPTESDPPAIVDPCAGRKGILTYTQDRKNHIWNRHGDPAATGSQYIAAGRDLGVMALYNVIAGLFGWDQMSSRDVLEAKIQRRNQVTFINAVGILSGPNVVYVSAEYYFKPPDIQGEVVGIDMLGPKKPVPQYTNVNTVIVSAADCQSVVTSHPGMPTRPILSNTDPRIWGTPTWWNLTEFKYIL